MPNITELLATRPWLLADGATGTNYFDMGLQSGDAPEMWNADHVDRVASLHRRFIEAGADIILTNSFGGSRYRLKLHRMENRVVELNRAAAEIAREEAERVGRPVVVAGSIGPTGEILEPVEEGLEVAQDLRRAIRGSEGVGYELRTGCGEHGHRDAGRLVFQEVLGLVAE